MKNYRTGDRIAFNIVGYTAVCLFALACVIPFLLVVSSSFATETSILRDGYRLVPSSVTLDAYHWVFRNPERIGRAYINTICMTALGTSLSLLLTTMAGYALSRQDFAWRNKFSFFFFFTTLFNGGLAPWYILCTRYLGFRNNYLALLLPLMFSVWNLIICKSFMRGIPYEITESAKVDGANDIRIYFQLILPISKPLLATIGLFVALVYWNDWYNSMLFIKDQSKQSLQYFLQDMLASAQAIKAMVACGDIDAVVLGDLPTESMKMAMTCVVTGPIVLLYPFVQRFFVKGLTIGAVKG